MSQDASVHVVHHPEGLHQGCRQCRKTHYRGTYAVGLVIGGLHRYLVGREDPTICCGEKKSFFKVFDHEGDAENEVARVLAILQRDGNTANLNLIQSVFVPHPRSGARN